MKKISALLLLIPFAANAQKNQPTFVNDTLTTTGGYKIYKGQILHIGTGTLSAGYFNFIKFHPSQIKNNTYSLQNSTLVVGKVKNFKYTGADDNSIRITGMLTYKDGKQEQTDIVMNFERATEDYDGLPGELIVAENLKRKPGQLQPVAGTKKQTAGAEEKKQAAQSDITKLLVADEIKKLFDLYKAGALTKDEYEAQKKKLLDRQ